MIIYHADKKAVEFPGVKKAEYAMDFSWGFYCTYNKEQAVRQANRGQGKPVVNSCEYEPKEGLKILKFEKMTDERLDFIAFCRMGNTHNYDIAEGPIDDIVWNYVNDFVSGVISRRQFWVLAEFKHPTRQISFHTLMALNCLTFKGGGSNEKKRFQPYSCTYRFNYGCFRGSCIRRQR